MKAKKAKKTAIRKHTARAVCLRTSKQNETEQSETQPERFIIRYLPGLLGVKRWHVIDTTRGAGIFASVAEGNTERWAQSVAREKNKAVKAAKETK